MKGQTLDILGFFLLSKFFTTVIIFFWILSTGGNPATWWLHHIVDFSGFTTTTSIKFVLGQSFSNWEGLRVSSYRGFFLFFYHEPYQPHRIDKVGVSFQTTPMGTITCTHSPRTGVDSSRHTHRSESSPIVQGLVQDLKVYQTHGVWLSCQNLTTADAFMTQWVFSFLPWQTGEYTRELHHAFAPKVHGLVYMTQWVLLFYHDKQMNTHRYYITHLHPKSTDWCTWRRWIPTGITSRICTQSLRTGVHDAVGFSFFYHDKQMNTHGYYITHLHPKSTDWCTWRSGFSFFTTTNKQIPTGTWHTRV